MSRKHEKEFEEEFLRRFYMDGKDMRYHRTMISGVLRFGNARYMPEGSIAGHKDYLGYLRINVRGISFRVHRIAFFLHNRYWPDEVDHINRDKADNRKENIRDASRTVNCKNKGMMINNTSGINGVSWDKESRKWKASIRVNKKLINLGRYSKIEDAELARICADVDHGFHQNHGRKYAV